VPRERHGRHPKAQSEGVNSAGGYLVPEEFENRIIILRNAYGLARRDLRVVSMGRDTITTPKLVSGLTMYFTGEGVAPTPRRRCGPMSV
jgi:HK97 family phage major capsid protein